MSEIILENYSEKSLVIRGCTKKIKNELKEMGAKWNPRLKNGEGWIISKRKEEEIRNFIDNYNNNTPRNVNFKNYEKKLNILENRIDEQLECINKKLDNVMDILNNLTKVIQNT